MLNKLLVLLEKMHPQTLAPLAPICPRQPPHIKNRARQKPHPQAAGALRGIIHHFILLPEPLRLRIIPLRNKNIPIELLLVLPHLPYHP